MQHVLADIIQNISLSEVDEKPFDHLYVKDVFPGEFYQELIARLPPLECYLPIGETGKVSQGAYPERHVLELVPDNIPRLPDKDQQFWSDLMPLITDRQLTMKLGEKFNSVLSKRFMGVNLRIESELLLIRDLEHYSIGPHSDSVYRFISVLFYLPRDDSLIEYGTTLYEPVDPGFTCEGGPHYPFEDFRRVKTAPFAPNSMIAFPPTNKSFHGVEPVQAPGIERNLLLLNVRWSKN